MTDYVIPGLVGVAIGLLLGNTSNFSFLPSSNDLGVVVGYVIKAKCKRDNSYSRADESEVLGSFSSSEIFPVC